MDSLGGYRLVRRLGSGTRSDVWLGSDGVVTAAIKVFRTGATRERIDAEIEALGRITSRHTVTLNDLTVGPDGVPCLILQRLTHWNLGRMLAVSRPPVGEAVTILAPLCMAVAAMHRAGIAHGRIRATSVLFDDVGTPVLASFGDAELFGGTPVTVIREDYPRQPTGGEIRTAVATDLEGLATLCLAALDPESAIARWLSRPADRDPAAFAEQLAGRLFELAAPSPVRAVMMARESSSTIIPLRVAPHEHEHEPDQEPEPATMPEPAFAHHSVRHGMSLLHVPDDLVQSVVARWREVVGGSPLLSMKTKITRALQPVRKQVWIMAGLVALVVIVAVALLPPREVGEGVRVSSPTPTPHSSSVMPSVPRAIRADDPVAAAQALLETRKECFSLRSVLCLDAVDQPNSTAWEADAAHVRTLQVGGADDGSTLMTPSTEGGSSLPMDIELVERLGDSVLLTVAVPSSGKDDETASLLLIKLDGGWRIRDIVTDTATAG